MTALFKTYVYFSLKHALAAGAGVVSVTSSSGASGASHGGRGGRGGSTAPFTVASNLPYGSIFDADTWGSGGGSTSTSLKNGGRGGGFIFLDISDKFVLNGIVSTNGLPAVVSISVDLIGFHYFRILPV